MGGGQRPLCDVLVPALWVSAAFGHGKSCAVDASFGARVRSRRHQARMTLEALAARSGVSRAALSKIERGEREPSLTVAVRIADSIGVLLPELLGEQGLPPVQVSPLSAPRPRATEGPASGPTVHVHTTRAPGPSGPDPGAGVAAPSATRPSR
ncbi:helix-turn-helix domain-containing protein [Saccharopolyspora spinosporotrichia]